MPKLNCNAENCAFNQSYLCKRQSIDVDGITSVRKLDTACSSFAKSGTLSLDTEFATFDKTPSIHTEIYCDCINCVYEKNQKCYADKVEISKDYNNNTSSTHCQTFEPID